MSREYVQMTYGCKEEGRHISDKWLEGNICVL